MKRDLKWQENFKIAAAYYKKNGNLKVRFDFKTKDGITFDPKGINLRSWLYTQRRAYYNRGTSTINEKKIKLLESIGYSFVYKDYEEKWLDAFNLAKAYYEHNQDLEIKSSFKTLNGYEEDENGYCLGSWLGCQRREYSKGRLTEDQIALLKSIKMRFTSLIDEDSWDKNYSLAKAYYEENNDLEIPISYVTEDGTRLGIWIYHQRRAYNKKGKAKINEEQIKLLESIGMRFSIKDIEEEWYKKYNLAAIYFKENRNLKIKNNFKTKDGITYDKNGVCLGMWLRNQKTAYSGIGRFKITDRQIKMLESIEINWYTNKTDNRLQEEEINEKNKIRKQKELLHRTYSLLNQYKESTLPNRIELNEEYIRQLRR